MIKNKMGIYKIINIINDKVYIGSSKNLSKRKWHHFNDLKNNKHHNFHLQAAWNKHGEENFKFEVIEFINNETELLLREEYWIKELSTCNHELGYNICSTASSQLGVLRSEESKEKNRKSHRFSSRPVLQLDTKGELIKYWEYGCGEISKKLNIDEHSIRMTVHKKSIRYGYIWVFEEEFDKFNIEEYTVFDESKVGLRCKILQYDKQSNLIKEWNTLREAADTLGVYASSISGCCKHPNKNKSAYGFIWRYENDPIEDPNKSEKQQIKKPKKPVKERPIEKEKVKKQKVYNQRYLIS